MTVANSLRESVTDYCAKIGADSMLVQGAGGNVSWKDGDTLWVKASGTWLANAKDEDIFVPVDLHALQKEIKAGDFSVTPKVKGESKLRPSIETLLHALMPHRVVVHLHAIEVLAYLVRKNTASEIKEKLGLLTRWAIVSYKKPGAPLAKAVAKVLERSPNTQIILLQNHGVVIGGEDVAEVECQLKQLQSNIDDRLFHFTETTKIPTVIKLGNNQNYLPVDIPDIHCLAVDPILYKRVKMDWALYPDHVVFLGHKSYCYDTLKLLNQEKKLLPELIFVKNVGVFSKATLSIAKLAQLKCYLDVIMRQSKQASLKILSKQEITQLLDWDAEQYRQRFVKSSC
jgi:rhamnose utilization protein RhaD (predicted bifunctional aldolase and dehydrogenase)